MREPLGSEQKRSNRLTFQQDHSSSLCGQNRLQGVKGDGEEISSVNSTKADKVS